jgi:predicted DCC family thiol-disulfide oxidoreductase YuxK
MPFTIFYDGHCPLCKIEMDHLKKRNTEDKLAFVDIMQDNFAQLYPDLDWQRLDERIHGMQEDGSMLIGLDVTHKAWDLLGKGWLYGPLRWPVIRFFADKGYIFFAKHRHRISYWVTRKKRGPSACENKFLRQYDKE